MPGAEQYPVRVKWIDKLQFLASDQNNHSIIIDTSREAGSEDLALSPMKLLLCALGACTAMDIVDILRKQRQEPTYFHVLLKGERNKDYPQYYKTIEMRYVLSGKSITEKALQRAIKLSREKYCSVEATLSRMPEITSSYEITAD